MLKLSIWTTEWLLSEKTRRNGPITVMARFCNCLVFFGGGEWQSNVAKTSIAKSQVNGLLQRVRLIDNFGCESSHVSNTKII